MVNHFVRMTGYSDKIAVFYAERGLDCPIKRSEDRTLNGFGVTQWAWSGRDGLELSEPVAA